MNKYLYNEMSELVIKECRLALISIDPESVAQLIDAILRSEKVFFIGVGRVMLALESMAKRFYHLGIKSVCVGQITEPAITNTDLLIVASGSGESLVPTVITRKACDLGAKIAYIGANPNSSIHRMADVFVFIPVSNKLSKNGNQVISQQLMTSLFEQSLFLLGDVLAQMIVAKNGIDKDNLWELHANLE